MKIAVTLNLEDTYEIISISPDLKDFQFNSPLKDGTQCLLTVRIFDNYSPFIPEVFNLAFGPLKADGSIDDTCEVTHANFEKTFSTILFGALAFLQTNPGQFVGIDGSNTVRAYWYFRMLQTNHDYLTTLFKMLGVKYYIRLLRGKTNLDPFIADNQDLTNFPHKILKGEKVIIEKLYNYFIFTLV